MTIDQHEDMVRKIMGTMAELNIKQKLDVLATCVAATINLPDEAINSCAQPFKDTEF